jgi:hypothetical protein
MEGGDNEDQKLNNCSSLRSHAEYCGVVAWHEIGISWRGSAKPFSLFENLIHGRFNCTSLLASNFITAVVFMNRIKNWIQFVITTCTEVKRNYTYFREEMGIGSLLPTPWHLLFALVLVVAEYILQWSPVLVTSSRARWFSRHCRGLGL